MNTFFLSERCCVCLGVESFLNSINASDRDNIKLSEKLESCVSEICWLEGPTQLICASCIDNLRIAYDFRRLCLESEEILHQNESNDSTTPQLCDPLKLKLPVTEILPPTNTTEKDLQHKVSNNSKLELPANDILPFSSMIVKNACKHKTSEILITKYDTNGMQNSGFLNTINNNIHFLKEIQLLPENLAPTSVEIKVEPTQIKQEILLDNSFTHSCNKITAVITDTSESICTADEMQNFGFSKCGATGHPEVVQIQKLTYPTATIKFEPNEIEAEIASDNSHKFSCVVCGKQYVKQNYFKSHMATHTDKKPFKCKYCEKTFFNSIQLGSHTRRHTKEKEFHCTVCSKMFLNGRELACHMLIHTREKSYICTYCNIRFIQESHLQAHMLSHTGKKKPYPCTYCEKRFVRPCELNSHLSIHTGEKRWKCDHCKKSFRGKSQLKTHMKWHTGDKYSCKICNWKFIYPSHLKFHMRRHADKQI